MTKDEITKSSQKKVQAVQTLMKQLDLVATSERMMTPDGFIKDVVYYTDMEKYDVDEEKPVDVPKAVGAKEVPASEVPEEIKRAVEEEPESPKKAPKAEPKPENDVKKP